MIPWKQNCPHITNGWCIQCVSRLGDAIEEYRDNDGSRARYDALALDKAREKLDAAMSNAGPLVRCSETPCRCACVHIDAKTCARWRDGFDIDDPSYEPRDCGCCCHENNKEEDEGWD